MKKKYTSLTDITQNVTVRLGAFHYAETHYKTAQDIMNAAEFLAKHPEEPRDLLMDEFVNACLKSGAIDA